jgi:methionyl-tRNA synthetase
MAAGADRLVVIIAPPPTPNGDLHVGHLAGPYLNGDIYARYLRACGRSVLYATGTDDSQTYVVATARKLGTTPEHLASRCWRDIKLTLEAIGIAVDGYAPFDDRYRRATLDFVAPLHAAGKFRLRRVRMPYSPRTGEYLMEGLVEGECPVCLTVSRGGLCETCGHPNVFDELVDPRSTVDRSDELTIREAKVLVLPIEEYRPQLTAYYEDRAPRWRPHIAQLAREVLDRPLPDFPITYPYHWGIPTPFPETPGQVINAWAEGMPASMYCTAYAAEQVGMALAADDELWRSEQDPEIVYFLGFDNAYFWGVTHLAALLAHDGRYAVPDTIVCNEFYELENEKFSTSKGHVVWGRDLLLEVPRDFIRFYLALTCPEHQRTNFSRTALVKVASERLIEPWNRLVWALGEAVSALDLDEQRSPVPEDAVARAAVMVERFRTCYRLSTFSATRAADTIVNQLARLEARAQALPRDRRSGERAVAALVHELVALTACCAPILIDLAEEVRERTGEPLMLGGVPPGVAEARIVRFPSLDLEPTARSAVAAVT